MQLLFLLMGCSDDKVSSKNETVEQVSDWCDGALGGAHGQRSWQADAAHAHVGFRLFTPDSDWKTADVILSEVLLGITDTTEWLTDYADGFDDACTLQAGETAGEFSFQS